MKKKGFTLIELLAVIVILAIIALIAVPVIMNIISESRKSAFKDTAYGIISAGELYYAEKLLDPNGMTEEATFTFTDGAVSPSGLNVKGSLPKSGNMKISQNGKVAIAVSNGTTCYVKGYEDSDVTTVEDLEDCHIPGEIVVKTIKDLAIPSAFTDNEVASCLTDGNASLCEPGTKVTIQVSKIETQNFYVISEYRDNIVLIMDRNLGEGIPWNDALEVSDGPTRALQYLEDQTSGWEYITPKTYVVEDENNPKVYADITRTNARARLLSYNDASMVGCYLDDSNCPTWMYDNLDMSVEHRYAYWTSYAYSGGSNGAYVVFDDYGLSNSSGMWVLDGTGMCGVRPVIEIAK